MIIPIRLSLSNAYLIKGERPILVDTGSPGKTPVILSALAQENVAVEDLSLILHTHGHFDHCGCTAELKQMSQAPVAIHSADAGMMRQGLNGLLKPTNLTARLIKPFIDKPFKGVEPDILIEEEISLAAYGLDGRIIFTPGHTTGSISVVLDNSEAIAGDMMMGGYLGGSLLPHRPGYHYYADDLNAVRKSIKKIMSLSPTKVYVGHGGPLAGEAILKHFGQDIAF